MKNELRFRIAFMTVLCAAVITGTYCNGFVAGERHALTKVLAALNAPRNISVPTPPSEWYESADANRQTGVVMTGNIEIDPPIAYLPNTGGSQSHRGYAVPADHSFNNSFFINDPTKAATLAMFQTPAPPPQATPPVLQTNPTTSPVAPVGPAPTPVQPAPSGPVTPTLAATIAALAVATLAFLNGIKSAIPQIGGKFVQVLAVAIATVGAIAVAPPTQPALVTAGAAITAALSAMGIHDYITQPSSGNANPPAASK